MRTDPTRSREAALAARLCILFCLTDASSAHAQNACAPKSITVGNAAGVCVLRNDGNVACFGTPEETPDLPRSDRGRGPFQQVSNGPNRACGVREDGYVECWADVFQQPVPDGQFQQVSVTTGYACGVRLDDTAWCGATDFAVPTPTNSHFLDVAASGGLVCGRRLDRTIECWGNEAITPPDGTFAQLAGNGEGGASHFCGVRDSGQVACWGSSAYPLVPPDGVFTKVAVAYTTACALDPVGSWVCWGDTIDVPEGSFSDLSMTSHKACGIRLDGEVVCNHDYGTPPLVGQFVQLSAGGDPLYRPVTCAVARDGDLECAGVWYDVPVTPPAGAFRQVAVSGSSACAIREDGTIACWGNEHNGQSQPPNGTFRDISAGLIHMCALRDDGTVACWGFEGFGEITPPPGQFVQIACGGSHVCALAANGSVECREFYEETPSYDAPPGPFVKISASPSIVPATPRSLTCGLKVDQTIECWGDDIDGSLDVPPGPFVDVAAGDEFSCGIRPGGAIECWGGSLYHDTPPSGAYSTLAVGPIHMCGLQPDGDIECAGYDRTASFCRPTDVCGNGVIEATEECDDGNDQFQAGRRCTFGCERTRCGQPVTLTREQPSASDALFTLRVAVGIGSCDAEVCDVNASAGVTTLDALLVLRKAVGLPASLACAA